jgi:hypothetical protein
VDAGVVCGRELVSRNLVAEDLGRRLELGADRKGSGPGESAARCQGGQPVGCEE